MPNLSDTCDLSIVIPTFNRAAMLERALAHLTNSIQCRHEIIVVDGASTDATAQVLDREIQTFGDRLKIIREEKREGFVKAANKGFKSATGRNVIWLNDDAYALPGSLDEAVRQIDDAQAEVAFLAMFHRWHSTRNIAYETVQNGQIYRLCHVRGTLYANFPIGRRDTFEKLGYFDERYYFNGCDPDLSLKAWHAGLRVEPAYGVTLEHDEVPDDRRLIDAELSAQDNNKLFEKWDLPEKNKFNNDFDATRPCTLRGLRQPSTLLAAA